MTHFKTLIYIFIILSLSLFSCASTDTDNEASISVFETTQEYLQIADTFSSLGNYTEAVEVLLKAKNLNTSNNALDFAIARNAALSEQWTIAIEHYELLLQHDSENILLKKSIAWVYAQSGDFEAAESAFESLYENHSYDKEVATNYILVLIAQNKADEAKAILDEYASLYPEETNIEELQQSLNAINLETEN